MPNDPRPVTTLGPIPTLPVFFKLQGRRVVLAGGGEPAVWKAEVLCAAGARLDIFAEAPCEALEALAKTLAEPAINLFRRSWDAADLAGAAIALGAIDDEAEAARFRDAATAEGVPVNVVDKPALCDFQFGTLIDRSPLVLAITTDGAAPVFGQAIRARVEALLPESLRGWAEAAKAWRPAVQSRRLPFRERRRFWEVFADRALRSPDQGPTAADLDACLAATDGQDLGAVGSVTLVGCGRGTLDDVTFGAVRALQGADMIVFDPDVRPEIVNLGRREAHKETVAGDAIEQRIARRVEAGAQVVWLGTGNAQTCHKWDARAASLARPLLAPIRLPGVGLCNHCSEANPCRLSELASAG